MEGKCFDFIQFNITVCYFLNFPIGMLNFDFIESIHYKFSGLPSGLCLEVASTELHTFFNLLVDQERHTYYTLHATMSLSKAIHCRNISF